MTEVLAVFRSRAQAADCNAKLRGMGIPCSLINTPKEAKIGCGLSVKLSSAAFQRAGRIISRAGYSAFYGFYSLRTSCGRTLITRL